VGFGFTVTVTCCVAEQPEDVVPVTVYVVVLVGLAVTLAVFVALNPVDGLHVYVPPPPAPLAVSTTEPPLQYVVEPVGVMVIVGLGLTVIGTVTGALVHPPVVPVTEYVVELGGLAVTGVPVVALNPVEGDQSYVVAPLALS